MDFVFNKLFANVTSDRRPTGQAMPEIAAQSLGMKLREKHPDRVPLLLVPATMSTRSIEQAKFLVPQEMSIGVFMRQMRETAKIQATETLFLFTLDQRTIPSTMTFEELDGKNQKQLLQLYYAFENTFG